MGALSWPEEALRANIIAQVSLALNRIWTEWYPSRGYSFNITGSPGYDQAYVNGRTVFAVMERLTAELGREPDVEVIGRDAPGDGGMKPFGVNRLDSFILLFVTEFIPDCDIDLTHRKLLDFC